MPDFLRTFEHACKTVRTILGCLGAAVDKAIPAKTPAASASAADDDLGGVRPPATPSGVTDAICQVLEVWHPWEQEDGTWMCSVDYCDVVFADIEEWRASVAPLIADRLETACLAALYDDAALAAAEFAANTFPQHQK